MFLVLTVDIEFIKGSKKHSEKKKKEKKRGKQLGYVAEQSTPTKEPYTKTFKGKIIEQCIFQL